jgi:hypothetical protein
MPGIRELFTVPLIGTTIPEFQWEHEDDLCDCSFQRISYWMNPYIGETEKIRLCCLYKELEDSFPHLFQHIKGYWDDDEREWITGQMEWNGENDMPRALWNRQLSIREGLPIEAIRKRTRLLEPPKGVPLPVMEAPMAERPVQQPVDIYDAYGRLYQESQSLRQGLNDVVSVLRGVVNGDMSTDDIEFTENGFSLREKEAD